MAGRIRGLGGDPRDIGLDGDAIQTGQQLAQLRTARLDRVGRVPCSGVETIDLGEPVAGRGLGLLRARGARPGRPERPMQRVLGGPDLAWIGQGLRLLDALAEGVVGSLRLAQRLGGTSRLLAGSVGKGTPLADEMPLGCAGRVGVVRRLGAVGRAVRARRVRRRAPAGLLGGHRDGRSACAGRVGGCIRRLRFDADRDRSLTDPGRGRRRPRSHGDTRRHPIGVPRYGILCAGRPGGCRHAHAHRDRDRRGVDLDGG